MSPTTAHARDAIYVGGRSEERRNGGLTCSKERKLQGNIVLVGGAFSHVFIIIQTVVLVWTSTSAAEASFFGAQIHGLLRPTDTTEQNSLLSC